VNNRSPRSTIHLPQVGTNGRVVAVVDRNGVETIGAP